MRQARARCVAPIYPPPPERARAQRGGRGPRAESDVERLIAAPGELSAMMEAAHLCDLCRGAPQLPGRAQLFSRLRGFGTAGAKGHAPELRRATSNTTRLHLHPQAPSSASLKAQYGRARLPVLHPCLQEAGIEPGLRGQPQHFPQPVTRHSLARLWRRMTFVLHTPYRPLSLTLRGVFVASRWQIHSRLCVAFGPWGRRN